MKLKTVLVLALLLPLSWTPGATAQNGAVGTVDVSIYQVNFAPEPVVNESITIQAIVNSTGPAVVEVQFRYTDNNWVNPGGEVPGIRSRVIRQFERADSLDFNITFNPPFDRRGFQDVLVTATVQGGGVDSDSSNNTKQVRTFFRHARLNVTFEQPATLDVLPNGETHLRYFVRNLGNFQENVTPAFTLRPQRPWAVYSYGPLPTILPGESATGILIVRSTSDTNLAHLALNLTVVSSLAAAANDIAEAPRLIINESVYAKRPAVAVGNLSSSIQVFPGETRPILFTVDNKGDVDALFRVLPSLEGSPSGWSVNMAVPPTWPANLTTPGGGNLSYPVALRPNETRFLQVNVTRQANAANATATLRIEVNSTSGDILTELLDATGLRAVGRAALNDAGPDLTARILNPPTLLYQGDTPSIRIEVTNAGRAKSENATLHLELRDNLRTIEERDLLVPALGAHNATVLTWPISTSGLKGAYVILGRVDINATQIDRNPENNTLRLDVHVRAPEIGVRAPEGLRAVPGGRLLLAASGGGFSVENHGDREENLVATLESPLEWLRNEWRVTVPPRSVMPLALEIDVPTLPGAERVVATFAARVESRPAFGASTTLVVEIDDTDPPRVQLVAPTGSTVVGEEARLAVRVEDASGVRRAEVLLRAPGGDRTALPLSQDATQEGVYSIRFRPPVAGAWLLEFRVEDASPQGYATVLGNVSWTVLPGSYQGLRPVNFGDGARVGRTPLRFADATDGATAEVFADVGLGYVSVGSIRTGGDTFWDVTLPTTEGPRAIQIRAVSKTGVTWERAYNVTVDRTPPTLAAPEASEDDDGRVELSVRADGAKEVLARFETDAGPVEVNLNPRGAALFGATVPAPSSWLRVTFIARDEAGNVNSTSVDAPEDETPGLGVAAVVGTLALLAILVNRRRRND